MLDLVDSGASDSFFGAKLVEKYQLTVNLDTSMVVMLTDGTQVEICKTCSVSIFTYTMSNKPLYFMI